MPGVRVPGGAAIFWIVARLLFLLPALALAGAFFFASFWFVSGILLGVGTISVGWLGAFAAMLAFDCLPEGALRDGPFALVRRIPPSLASLNPRDDAVPMCTESKGDVTALAVVNGRISGGR